MKIFQGSEYGLIIKRHIQSSFPKVAEIKGKDLLEVLTSIMVGSKELRYGPIPPPENLVTIRKTILSAIEKNLPIPVLVPWGGRKMDKRISIDVAELSGLKQLIAVDTCIKKVYAPGLLINIRIEDTNAEWLYKETEGIERYSFSMAKLIDIVKGDTKMQGVRESSIMDKEQYMLLSSHYSNLLNIVITGRVMGIENDDTVGAMIELEKAGWKGIIPHEQINYYLERYERLYPDTLPSKRIGMLADYFAGSKVRYDLKGRAFPETEVGSFIQINFAHPVPAAPDGLFNNTLYYRTIPNSHGRTHISPWRCKGYLEITGDRVHTKIINPGSRIEELNESVTVLTDDNDKNVVELSTDYVYEGGFLEAMADMPYGMMI